MLPVPGYILIYQKLKPTNMIRAIIVEDELHSRETLKNLLEEFCDDIQVVGMVDAVQPAIEVIRKEKPDLVFMDIELQTGTGFDVLSQVQDLYFEVIFTTAFEHYAIRAIKFSSIDYLLKPIDVDELQKAVEKVREKKNEQSYKDQLELLLQNISKKPSENRKICLATLEGIEFVGVKEILYCEANGAYTTFYLQGGRKILVSRNLKEYEMLLEENEFMRVHNSFLINLHEVKRFVKGEGGYILMNNQAQISISQKKRDVFMERMTTLG
jgi:two-component system LytT family response regulator